MAFSRRPNANVTIFWTTNTNTHNLLVITQSIYTWAQLLYLKGGSMYVRKIVCLANSRKPPSGRCIAGKVTEGSHAGQWLRPVSTRPSKEVSEEERRYENGQRANILEYIQIPLIAPDPIGHQTENAILADNYYWTQHGRATWSELNTLIDPYQENFWTTAESTHYGMNDKISERAAQRINSSLKLIKPENLQIQILSEEGYQGAPNRKRVRSSFCYHGRRYILSVTDPFIEEHYLSREIGHYAIERSLMCVSLAEVWNGYAFRLAASIITPERC